MKRRILGKLTIIIIVGSFLTISFNNCSKSKESSEETSSQSLSLGDDACENQLIDFYNRSYYPFLVSNCKSCHATGPGKGQFANEDVLVAYKDFMQIGYSKVSSNAINDNHNSPYSGSRHTQTVNDLKITWLQAQADYSQCKGTVFDPSEGQTISERSNYSLMAQQIPTLNDNEEKKIVFDMTTDLYAKKDKLVPGLPGAKLSVMVRKVLKGTERYYSVHSPRFFGSSDDIRIKGFFTKINSRYINYSTNFRYLDAKIPKGTQEANLASLLSTGGIVIAGAIFPEDKLSFDIELIEKTVILPPPPPVSISFSGQRFIKAGAAGNVELTVSLDKPSTEAITLSYESDTTALCNNAVVNNSNCLPEIYNLLCPNGVCPKSNSANLAFATSRVGTTFRRFDWDYELGNTSIRIPAGETSVKINIKTSKDIRLESNKVLMLRLVSGLGSQIIPESTSRAAVVFNKVMNPAPANGEVTFSQLMTSANGGGTLFNTCTSCHNSVKRDGGYDIQDYELMISSSKGILVPGADSITTDANDNKIINPVSLMYRRTLPAFTPESYLMPREKTLDTQQFNDLENWLTHGAKNN